jgi:ABC-type transport system involved in multi-copper enzyme maturation permease subunit
MTTTLIAHSLRRYRSLLAGLGVILALFQLLLTVVGRTLERSGTFDQIAALVPEFVRVLLGPSFVAMLSLSGIVGLGYFHVAVMAALIGLAVAIATEPTAEIESGMADLILSRPVLRRAVITRSIVLLVTGMLLTIGMMLAGTTIGLTWLVQGEAAARTARLAAILAVNLAALVVCCGALALVVGAGNRRRAVAGTFASLLLLVLFLADVIGRMWKPLDPLARLSPFRYYSPYQIVVAGEVPVWDISLLAGVALVACVLAYMVFSRRDF